MDNGHELVEGMFQLVLEWAQKQCPKMTKDHVLAVVRGETMKAMTEGKGEDYAYLERGIWNRFERVIAVMNEAGDLPEWAKEVVSHVSISPGPIVWRVREEEGGRVLEGLPVGDVERYQVRGALGVTCVEWSPPVKVTFTIGDSEHPIRLILQGHF